MNPNRLLEKAFSSHWKSTALVTADVEFTYEDIYTRASGIADWLSGCGCKTGDAVALRLPNGWPLAVSYLACILGRYRFVPVNPELPLDDQAYILNRLLPSITLDNESLLSEIGSKETSSPVFDCPEGAVAGIFFTSGTTGKPKGVCHSLAAMVGNVVSFNNTMGIDETTRLYHILPMYYMAGFLNSMLSPWLAGGTVLLGPRFMPAYALDFWKQPLEWKANTIWLTPTIAAILARMCRERSIASTVASDFTHIFCGTAPLTTAIRSSFQKVFGVPLQESYGMSEILLASSQTRDEALQNENVGRLLPGVSAAFRLIPDSQEKEVVLQTPYALMRYIMESGEHSPLLPGDDEYAGAMPTGDIGYLNRGRLVITGRAKDLIIRGGLNISPGAVEDVLLRQEGVQEAAVVGIPHDVWGESILACVVANPTVDTDQLQSDLMQRCMRELAEGMRPDRFIWLDEIPKADTGKIQKHLLRKLAA